MVNDGNCRQDHHTGSMRSRRNAPETGSFGKSTRRSRTRTATPARGRENATQAGADKIFGDWMSNNQAIAAAASAASRAEQDERETAAGQQAQEKKNKKKSQPVEVMLRGYRSSEHQYAAIERFESLAGTILEDYPRQPPPETSRWTSQLRDPSFTRHRRLGPEERAMVNRTDGGEHWVKVTFESAEAADRAVYASPQKVQGHLIYAEPYRGVKPPKDEAYPDYDSLESDRDRARSLPAAFGGGGGGGFNPLRKTNTGTSTFPTNFRSRLFDLNEESPPGSLASSQTIETGTIATTNTSSSHTVVPTLDVFSPIDTTAPATSTAASSGAEPLGRDDPVFCRRIPTARRANLLPAEQALLPQQSAAQRFLAFLPILSWFGGSFIGNEVPRTETGEFDRGTASLYWQIMWFLDYWFKLFGGDLTTVEKDD